MAEDRTAFSLSIDTRCLHERLQKAAVGETVSYAELSKIIGRDVRTVARTSLQSARRIAQRDDQIVFGTVSKVGIRRLSDAETVASGNASIMRIRREAKRGVARISALSAGGFERLSDADRLHYNAQGSLLAAFVVMAKPKSVARIAAAVNTSATGQLPVGRTLELFRGPVSAAEKSA